LISSIRCPRVKRLQQLFIIQMPALAFVNTKAEADDDAAHRRKFDT
jgi:hypothetical protein